MYYIFHREFSFKTQSARFKILKELKGGCKVAPYLNIIISIIYRASNILKTAHFYRNNIIYETQLIPLYKRLNWKCILLILLQNFQQIYKQNLKKHSQEHLLIQVLNL